MLAMVFVWKTGMIVPADVLAGQVAGRSRATQQKIRYFLLSANEGNENGKEETIHLQTQSSGATAATTTAAAVRDSWSN